MPVPSVTKLTKQGVEFTSNLDRTKYLLVELQRAAMKDVAKFLRRKMLQKGRRLPGLRSFKVKRVPNAFQYWVRRRENDLLIGIKHDTWYGVQQELGTMNQPKRSILRDTVFENIDTIRLIQGQYLSTIEDENRALGLIEEEEEVGDEEG